MRRPYQEAVESFFPKDPVFGPENFCVDDVSFRKHVLELAAQLREYGPFDGLVAISRGGLSVAQHLGNALNIRNVDTLCIESRYRRKLVHEPIVTKEPQAQFREMGRACLVVDELCDKGKTLDLARSVLPEAFIATVYATPESFHIPDMFAVRVPPGQRIVLPWHSPDLEGLAERLDPDL